MKKHKAKHLAASASGGNNGDDSGVARGPCRDEDSHFFNGYDLKALGVPREAWPCPTKQHHGKFSYTVSNPETGSVPFSETKHVAFVCSRF